MSVALRLPTAYRTRDRGRKEGRFEGLEGEGDMEGMSVGGQL